MGILGGPEAIKNLSYAPLVNQGNGMRKSKQHPRIFLPDHPSAWADGRISLHRLLAEKALGKQLPKNVVVHHHTSCELVICENENYHKLLHKRTRALYLGGNVNLCRCYYCKQYFLHDQMNSCGSCKKCQAEKTTKWAEENPEKRKEISRRAYIRRKVDGQILQQRWA